MLQHGWTGLHKVSCEGHTELMGLLLQHEADVNTVDSVSEDVRVGVNVCPCGVC